MPSLVLLVMWKSTSDCFQTCSENSRHYRSFKFVAWVFHKIILTCAVLFSLMVVIDVVTECHRFYHSIAGILSSRLLILHAMVTSFVYKSCYLYNCGCIWLVKFCCPDYLIHVCFESLVHMTVMQSVWSTCIIWLHIHR